MEAMSTTVPSSINIPKLHHNKNHHVNHLKPPILHHHNHHNISKTTTVNHHTSISTKPTNNITQHKLSSSTFKPTTTSPIQTHRNVATGYAAALIDVALCSNTLLVIHKDVKRLLKWLQVNQMLKGVMNDANLDEGVKGRVIMEVAEKAKLRKQVVAMVKMLVAKNKSSLVEQVMVEFQRIYFELNTSSSRMMAV
uniref:uncharacterized protein LOC122592432 n=1 Tax=Erigeron canadensis TaxID=72917 RepID=UPI001CB9C6E6|nr:uncharacterized protein LOC122592432 [Erigeron canadensis]